MRRLLVLLLVLCATIASAQTTITDTFDRDALGPHWTQLLTGLPITSDLVVEDGAVRATLPNTAAAATYEAVLAADQWAQCRIYALFYGGPVVRSSGTAATGTWNNYEAYASSATNIRIARHVQNRPSTLANAPAPWSGIARITDGDLLRIEARGSVIRVLLNGVVVGQVTDTSHVAGSAGVITHYGTRARLDDFAAGDLP